MKTPSHRFTVSLFTDAARILGVAALVAGCGLIKVQGLGGSSTPASSARAGAETTPPAGAKGGEARPAAAADPELVKAYLAIEWKAYPARYRDPGAIKAMHLTAVDRRGKPRFAATPDAAWLPGWNPGQADSIDLPFQVAQAGINRTWQAACFADYAAYRAGWTKLDATLRPRLDAARAVTNFYERTAALRELYAATSAAAAAQHVELPVSHPGHWAGLRWEIARELMQTAIAARRDAAITQILGPIADELDPLVTSGRAYAADDAVERDAFCATAIEVGTQQTGPLPTPAQTGIDLSGVTFPVNDARAADVQNAVAALVKVDRPQWSGAKARSLDDLAHSPREPVLVRFEIEDPAFIVDKIERKGEHVELLATSSRTSAIGYGCKQTDKVESYTDGGTPMYQKHCKTGSETRSTQIAVTFDDLPATIAIAPGDAVFLYGDVVKLERTSKVERGGAVQRFVTRAEVRGRHLTRVKAR